jgi:hypothetical protein
MDNAKDSPTKGQISPQLVAAAATVSSGWVNAGDALTFAAAVTAGALGGATNVVSSWQQATSAAGAGAKALTGNGTTNIAMPTADSTQDIDLDPSDMDVNNGFGFFQLRLTVTGGTGCFLATTIRALYPKVQ